MSTPQGPAPQASREDSQADSTPKTEDKWAFERDALGRVIRVEGKGELGLFTTIFVAIDDLNQTTKKFAKESSHYARWLQWLTISLLVVTVGLIVISIVRL